MKYYIIKEPRLVAKDKYGNVTSYGNDVIVGIVNDEAIAKHFCSKGYYYYDVADTEVTE